MAATVSCGMAYESLAFGSPGTEVPYYWFAYGTAGGAVFAPSWGTGFPTIANVTNTWVEPGAPCPTGTGVAMSQMDYNAMIQAANVVTELQHGWDFITVALICVALLAGTWFGWTVVQRGGSK